MAFVNLTLTSLSGTVTLSHLAASCGIPVDQYLWLNDLHPTYPAHNLMAARALELMTA